MGEKGNSDPGIYSTASQSGTKSKTPTKLALTLPDVFLTREKLAKSLCTAQTT